MGLGVALQLDAQIKGLSQFVVDQVPICLEGAGRRVVAHPALQSQRAQPAFDRKRRAGMAEDVKADAFESGPPSGGAPPVLCSAIWHRSTTRWRRLLPRRGLHQMHRQAHCRTEDSEDLVRRDDLLCWLAV